MRRVHAPACWMGEEQSLITGGYWPAAPVRRRRRQPTLAERDRASNVRSLARSRTYTVGHKQPYSRVAESGRSTALSTGLPVIGA
jgi:hypothetical protein